MTTLLASGELSSLGLGAWAMGGPGWQGSWGPQDDDVSRRTIERALDLGMSWIDTAPVYGLGHSEEVVGSAVRGRRGDVFLATKCINRWDESRVLYQSGKAASVRVECEESLQRLGVEALDLLQIHGPTQDAPIEETWGELLRLKAEGKTRYVGVSNLDVDAMQRCLALGHVDSAQPPYNLLARGIEDDLLPFCAANGIAVVPYGPMAQGMLSGSFSLEPVGQLAIAWVAAHPAVTSPIVGARRPEQIDENVAALALADEVGLRETVDAAVEAGVT